MSGLDELDPTRVTLPVGTEVTTRAAITHEGRVVPMGAVGRLTSRDATTGQVVVDLVGVGRVRCARSDVVPRKQGQLRYAVRRQASWEALLPTIVLEATVGSRAWGLSEEGSDHDRRGVFALPFPWTTGLSARVEDLVSEDGSATYWEIEKALRQGLRADPNTLEALFVPSATAKDVIGAWLLEARDAFVSREIFGSFGRYAVSQLRKLEQAARLAEHRATLVGWLRATPDLTLDQAAERLAREAVRGEEPAQAVLRAKEHIKQLYRSMHDQTLLDACDYAALVRFAATSELALAPARELRPKNAYNLLRLLYLAAGWLADGRPVFEATGARRARLFAIKRGEIPLGEVLAEAESLLPELLALKERSPLPVRPDVERADQLLRRVRTELARRSLACEPGPWGRDMPPLPAAGESGALDE